MSHTPKTFNREAAVTRSLLGYGVLAGPFYLVVGILQGLMREGFDFSRHALSHLANGEWGWIQTANLALTGLMVIAAAVGIVRVIGSRARAAGILLGLFGVGMIGSAIFAADPVAGFPVGTPDTIPATIGFFAPMLGLPSPVLGIWYAVIVGWAWLLLLSLHLYGVSPSPEC